MINKESFCKIMYGLRDYNDELDKFMDCLNSCLEQSFMVEILDKTMNALVDDMESNLEIDNDAGSWIYYWAWELDWGRSDKAKNSVKIDDVVCPLVTAEQLYDLIVELNASEIDVEEVVRCEYCEHSIEDGFYCCGNGLMIDHMTLPNDFCSNGEKRDNNG